MRVDLGGKEGVTRLTLGSLARTFGVTISTKSLKETLAAPSLSTSVNIPRISCFFTCTTQRQDRPIECERGGRLGTKPTHAGVVKILRGIVSFTSKWKNTLTKHERFFSHPNQRGEKGKWPRTARPGSVTSAMVEARARMFAHMNMYCFAGVLTGSSERLKLWL